MNIHTEDIGDEMCKDTPRRVAKCRKNRPRNVDKSVLRKNILKKLECGPMPNVMVATT